MTSGNLDALKRAAAQGQPDAQLQLAIACMTGAGVPEDAAAGRDWLARAAQGGQAAAARFLGLIYLRGMDVVPDFDKAVQLLQQAADANDPEAAWCLAAFQLGSRDEGRDPDAGQQRLEQAARAGHPRAMAQLAWLLDGRAGGKVRAAEAVDLAQRAARAGDGGALLLLAEWSRLGRWLGQDLAQAGALARRAAELNWALADEIAAGLPAGGTAEIAPGAVSMERAVPWPQPELTMLSWAPRVVLIRELLSDFECAEIANAAEEHLMPSFIVDQDGAHAANDIRTSQEVRLRAGLRNLVVHEVEARLADWSMVPLAHGEYPLVLRYEQEQSFEQHYDYFIPERFAMGEGPLAFGGQRVATQLVYLNEAFDGGETRFDNAGIVVTPERGMCMLFHNVGPDHNVDPLTRHTGVAVRRGVKWLLSRWIRELPFDQPAADHPRDRYKTL